MIPTRWTTASQPAMSASRPRRTRMSPSMRSTAPSPWRSRSEPRRTRQRTMWPSARRAWITARPTNPVPPVTNTRAMMRPYRNTGARGRLRCKISVVTRLALLSCAFLSLVLAGPGAPAALDFTSVDEAAGEAVTSGEIPGAVILIGRDGDTLYHRAFGWREVVPEPRPMMTDTLFDIASLTKPFGTTLAVMSLVERGAIDLDAPLSRYLKEFKGNAYDQVTI